MTDITSFTKEYRWLSNFWEVDVTLDNDVYPSVEAAYQAAKTLIMSERVPFLTAKPAEAKKLGKTVTKRADWDQIKVSVMRDLLFQKFKNPELKEWLLRTGDAQLIEGNWWGDTFWGVCRGKGENHLGKLLMQVRRVYANKCECGSNLADAGPLGTYCTNKDCPIEKELMRQLKKSFNRHYAPMKLFTTNDFSGVWPVGASAIVLAKSEEDANEMIKQELAKRNLTWDGKLKEVDLKKEGCIILTDGEY